MMVKEPRFDELAKAISRGQVLKLVAGTALAGAAGVFLPDQAEARRRRRRRGGGRSRDDHRPRGPKTCYVNGVLAYSSCCIPQLEGGRWVCTQLQCRCPAGTVCTPPADPAVPASAVCI